MIKKLGLRKKYYSSLSSKDFAGYNAQEWQALSINKQRLISSTLFQNVSAENQESLLSFGEKGYAVINNYLAPNQVEEINAEVEKLLQQKRVSFTNGKKIMMAIHVSPFLRKVGNDEKLKEVFSALLNGNAILFQSINFLMGSEQATHSDSIHMTTFPLGGLLGAWFALEDITEENGPLHYFPGSHKMPYYLNADYNNEGGRYLLGNKSYNEYENMIRQKIADNKLEKRTFLARKGDLLIWHANLFHGGEPHINKTVTRKSMVFHYFKENVICYHEITKRPALIRRYG